MLNCKVHPRTEISAYWKDNHTVIETGKGCTVMVQYRIIQSFNDVVNVEYIERD